MSVTLRRVRPTKGFLLELKKRIVFIEEGYKLLKLKRDELAKTIRSYLEFLEAKRAEFEAKVEKALSRMRAAYAFLGSGEVESQINPVETITIQIYPKSVMGCLIPYVREINKVKVTLNPVLRSIAKDFEALIEDLVKIAEVESSIERIAEELGATNRKVNALEKYVIPELKRSAKYIEDMLDEEMLEEVIRTKIIRNKLAKRR
ncbi:MAG: V-type ATP synthase subunit D [Nitrososphaerota archaeon]|nr:V-type ATP synthase subunit D [Nitrososphaerales archaeon]MCX8191434.1 V-type ATP synthase subunit D [Nitrososphaerales archaeon]MDW8045151.1 V-type ATP synthase subunit D [Nitrososphaerota archaeon]